MLLMLSLAVLSAAIIVVAWPGKVPPQATALTSAQTEVGTAPKGWMKLD